MGSPGSSPVAEDNAKDVRQWRSGFIATTAVLVILTWLLLRDPSIGVQGLSILLVIWVLLGWASFFAATNAYGPLRSLPRPDLAAARGVPAWAFFLGGGGALLAVAGAWVAWGNLRTALNLAGISITYLSISYPHRLSIRRAAISGVGLGVSAVGLVFFA